MDTPANTFSTFPTRDFTFILDPDIAQRPATVAQSLRLIVDLSECPHPIQTILLTPSYLLADPASLRVQHPIHVIREAPHGLQAFTPSPDMRQEDQAKLMHEDERLAHRLSLLAISTHLQADGIIINDPVLLEIRYSIYQYHRIRLIPTDEMADMIEIIAHGHSIFWSASNPYRELTVDDYYLRMNWKTNRLLRWYDSIRKKLTDSDLETNLRTTVMRHLFIQYARDMVRFYELQQDYYFRRGLQSRFWVPLGYHITMFYLLLWGMLDQLTLITKQAKGFNVVKRFCGIRSKAFLQELRQREPMLADFIAREPISEWITIMADMRHLAAHSTITTPTELLIPTEDSEKSYEEILGIVRTEMASSYRVFDEATIKFLEPQWVFHWRLDKMKRAAPHMVFIQGSQGAYFRSPTVSIDHDVMMLNAVIDAFLVKVFSA